MITFSSFYKLSLIPVSAFLIGTIHPASVKAAVINIDFFDTATNIYSGLGAAPDFNSNTFWNGVGLGGATNLLFSDGTTSSGVGVSTSGFNSSFSNGGNLLLADRLIPNDGDASQKTVAISGLNANTKYNLYAYTGFYSQLFSVGVISGTATGEGFTENNPINWLEGTQYAKLSNVLSDNSGLITLAVRATSPNPNGFSPTTVISGLQLESVTGLDPTTVPDPSSLLGLLTLGTLGATATFKRKLKREQSSDNHR